MSSIKQPAPREHAIGGSKRRRRVVPLVTAAAISASLIAGAVGPASAAVPQPARTAPIYLVSGASALPAVSLGDAASLNKVLDRETITVSSARDGVTVDATAAVPAGAQDRTITILPGITLTISSTGIRLSMTKQAVTEVENVLGFGQSVASLVGAILGATGQVPLGSPIAGIVASSLGLANGLLKFCTASDGSAAFTIPWFGLPSCSGFTLLA